jgi:hypothetical protein
MRLALALKLGTNEESIDRPDDTPIAAPELQRSSTVALHRARCSRRGAAGANLEKLVALQHGIYSREEIHTDLQPRPARASTILLPSTRRFDVKWH